MAWRAFLAWFFALALFMLAMLSLGLRLLLPNAPQLTDALLSSIHSQAGLQIEADQLQLDWRGLQAVVQARNLSVNRDGAVMQVELARLYLDLYRSVSERAPRFDQVELVGLDMQVAGGSTQSEIDPDALMGLLAAPLAMADDVRLSDARLAGDQWVIEQLSGRISQVDNQPQLNFSAQLRIPQMGAGLTGRLQLTNQGARGYAQYQAQGSIEPYLTNWTSAGELWVFAGDGPLRADWRGQVESDGDQIQGLGQLVRRADGGWQGQISRLKGALSGQAIKLDQGRFVWNQGLTLDVSGVRVAGFPDRLGSWLPADLAERLQTINPQFELTQGYYDAGLGYWRLGNSQSQPYEGIPGGQFAQATLATKGSAGVAKLSGISEFHANVMGPEAIEMERGGGTLAWQRTGQSRWSLAGQGLELVRSDLAAVGRFDMALSPEIDERKFDLVIQANSQSAGAEQWVPTRLFGQTGQQWWDQAAPTMTLNDGLFWWHNGLDRYRSLELTAQDIELTPALDWPRARLPVAEFSWNGQDFAIQAGQGRLGDIPVDQVRVSQSPGQPWRIRAQSQLAGEGLPRVIDQLPIELGDWTDELELSGSIASQVDLSVGNQVTGQVRLVPKQASAVWMPLGLTVDRLEGQVVYDLGGGLVDSALTGEFEGRPVRLELADGKTFGLEVQAEVDVKQAATRFAPVLSPYLSGVSVVRAQVGETWSLETRLRPAQSELPMPLAQGGDLRIEGRGEVIQIAVPDQLELRIAGDQWAGRADQMDLIGWAQVAGQNDQASSAGSPNLDLRIGDTRLGDLKVGASVVTANAETVQLVGPNAQATIQLGQPLRVRIDKLHGNSPEDVPDSTDYQPAPDGFPDMILQATDIQVNDNRIDSLDVRITRTDQGVLFAPMTLELGGAQVQASTLWSNQAPRSSMQATIDFQDLGQLLDSQGLGRALETESGQVSMDLAWTGYPWAPQFKKSTGDVVLAANEGRFLDSPNAAEALRLLGIFNLGTVTRRLRLDFSDLLKPGLAFDSLAGQARLRSGRLSMVEPLTLLGPGSSMYLTGSSNLADNTLDHRLRVQVPLSAQLPAATLLAGFPALAAGVVLLFDQVAGDRLSRIGETNYSVTGTFDAPVIEPLKPEAKQ